MHPTVLAEKKDLALKQLRAAAEKIVGQLELPAVLLDGINRQEKRPEIQELYLLQGLAELVEGIALAVGAEAPPEPVLEEIEKRGRRKGK